MRYSDLRLYPIGPHNNSLSLPQAEPTVKVPATGQYPSWICAEAEELHGYTIGPPEVQP
jgi:hypothetical protein